MKNKYITAFWIGFAFTTGLTAWIYWLWRQKRVVAPKPLVIARQRPPQPREAVQHPTKSSLAAIVSDALEEIRGIGPVFANRLNEAGVLTFEQLASTSTEELARITGVTRWDPADWKSEATRLAAAKKG